MNGVKRVRINLLLLLLILLSSCGTLNNQFDCPMTPGIHCKRVDEINAMVDRGELTGRDTGYHALPIAKNQCSNSATSCTTCQSGASSSIALQNIDFVGSQY